LAKLAFAIGTLATKCGISPVALNWWKLFTLQQDIDEVRRSGAETETTVKADADPLAPVCGGKGWHHGWDAITRDRVMLRRLGVDRRRAS
jgi:hypothetical protein